MLLADATSAPAAARMFRGFAEPTRIAILLELAQGERRVTDLVHAVGRPQSNVSGHLACLKACRLVADRPGARRQVFYRLASDEVADLLRAGQRLLAATGPAMESCDDPMMEDGDG